MALNDTELGKILLEGSYVSEEELKAAQKQASERSTDLLPILMERGLLTQSLYENALAEHYSLPFYDIQQEPPKPEFIAKLPEAIAREYHAIIVKDDGKSITVATSDPGEATLEEAIRINYGKEEAIMPEKTGGKETETKKKKGGKKDAKKSAGLFGGSEDAGAYAGKIQFVFTAKGNIDAALSHYRKPLATRFQSIIEHQRKVAPEILEEILEDAITLRASDIHFEPQEETVIVRFRVDGVLHEAGRVPREHYEGVVNRVKIEANMRIDEHYSAQDGAIRHVSPTSGKLDIRVNIVPVIDGEKIVMRLLAAYVKTLSLGDLGFSEEAQQLLSQAAMKPFGMILTTGPTGSGKSTTLSALLKMRNQPDVNISTIEDPVEYKIRGVNHIQVNAKSNLTFANGLRALVRQDPDVILVGEIRDGETADISVNAALTGHLLFSTLHANDASTAVPRMLDMDVEPFLLASTLEVVIGQRLVRRICNECRYSYGISISEAQSLFPGAKKYFTGRSRVTLYKGKGCASCGNTGFKGRVGIYELLEVTPEIEALIIARATSADINALARKQGMKLMFEDGFTKTLSGLTTIEELLRVAAPPDVLLSQYKHGKKK